MSNEVRSERYVAPDWFWYGLRDNTINNPLRPGRPNLLQRLWMRVAFGMVEVRW